MDETELLAHLICWQTHFTSRQLLDAIKEEGTVFKRRAILFALKFLLQQMTQEADIPRKSLDISRIREREKRALDQSRRNFVRRIYQKNPLFALDEISTRYSEYSSAQLQTDLKRAKGKHKRKKRKISVDLRRKQLEKLAWRLRYGELSDQEYHQICNRMALLQGAHNKRLDIPLTVNIAGQLEVYHFPWKTREEVIKAFVALANQPGTSHQLLIDRRKEILSSSYSF